MVLNQTIKHCTFNNSEVNSYVDRRKTRHTFEANTFVTAVKFLIFLLKSFKLLLISQLQIKHQQQVNTQCINTISHTQCIKNISHMKSIKSTQMSTGNAQ